MNSLPVIETKKTGVNNSALDSKPKLGSSVPKMAPIENNSNSRLGGYNANGNLYGSIDSNYQIPTLSNNNYNNKNALGNGNSKVVQGNTYKNDSTLSS